jgi:hypothetical protein
LCFGPCCIIRYPESVPAAAAAAVMPAAAVLSAQGLAQGTAAVSASSCNDIPEAVSSD